MSDFILSGLFRSRAEPRASTLRAALTAALAGTMLASGCGLSVLKGLTHGDKDAGSDAGMHSHPGMDAGHDAGADAGQEKDAGHVPDAGMGMKDAGMADAGGVDAGADAGCVLEVPPTTYKRVFLTKQAVSGPLGSLKDVDDKCKLIASQRCLGGDWKAWLSDSMHGPNTRFAHSSLPYHRLDTVRVANDWNDLVDGTLDAAISVTEDGSSITTGYVWTGTTTSGNPFAGLTCNDWQSGQGSDLAKTGSPGSTGSEWTHGGDQPCAALARIYCFEQ